MSTMTPQEIALIELTLKWREMLEAQFRRQGKTVARRLALCIVEGLVFVKLAQQRKLERADRLSSLLSAKNTVQAVQSLFINARIKYHSAIFDLPLLHDSLRLRRALRSVVRRIYNSRKRFSPSILGKIYETDRDGRKNGVFYTPDFISEYIVDRTLKPLLCAPKRHARSGKAITVVDPACGAGAFLLKAFDCILQAGGAKKSFEQKQDVLLASIFGVDIDATGVELTKLSLLLKLYDGATRASLINSSVPDLSANIRCGNALISSNFTNATPLRWAKAFSRVTRGGGFDAVIVNPPYVNIRQLTRSHGAALTRYLAGKYVCARGAYDLYVLFFEKSLALLKPGGRLGMIFPNKVATFGYAAGCRKMLLAKTRIESIADISPMCVFSKTGVYPYILICEKTAAHEQHCIEVVEAYSRADLKRDAAVAALRQSALDHQKGFNVHGNAMD